MRPSHNDNDNNRALSLWWLHAPTAQMEEWEAARTAQARAVDVLDTSKRGAAQSSEEEGEEEEEYVPVDAMFRDELDVSAADGSAVRVVVVVVFCLA